MKDSSVKCAPNSGSLGTESLPIVPNLFILFLSLFMPPLIGSENNCANDITGEIICSLKKKKVNLGVKTKVSESNQIRGSHLVRESLKRANLMKIVVVWS